MDFFLIFCNNLFYLNVPKSSCFIHLVSKNHFLYMNSDPKPAWLSKDFCYCRSLFHCYVELACVCSSMQLSYHLLSMQLSCSLVRMLIGLLAIISEQMDLSTDATFSFLLQVLHRNKSLVKKKFSILFEPKVILNAISKYTMFFMRKAVHKHMSSKMDLDREKVEGQPAQVKCGSKL